MSDEDIKQAYWRGVRALTAFAVLLVVLAVILVPPLMPGLNAYRFLRFPLGYFLATAGAAVGYGFLIYIFFGMQARVDRAHNMTIQF